MNKKLSMMLVLGILIIIILAFQATSQYNDLVVVYQNAQKAAINGFNTMVLGYSKIQDYKEEYDKYLTADVKKAEVYHQSLSTLNDQLKNQEKQYIDENNVVLNPANLDLNELVKNRATPTDMFIVINNYRLDRKSVV